MTFSYNRTDIKQLIGQSQIRLKRKFGQNFLTDTNLCKSIVKQAELNKDEIVLEIGTGLGQLTHLLAQQAKEVHSFEIDSGVFQLAEQLLTEYPNIQLYHESAIEQNQFPTSLHQLVQKVSEESLVLVSNFSYAIGTVFLLEWGYQQMPFSRMIAVLQKEMGEKFLATPGSSLYGIPSILGQYYYDIVPLKIIPPQVFWPVPEVDSIVLKIVPRQKKIKPETQETGSDFSEFDEKRFLSVFNRVVKGSFHLRRKRIGNSLGTYLKEKNGLKKVLPLLEKAEIDFKLRGENLSLEDFLRLAQVAYQEKLFDGFEKNIPKKVNKKEETF